MTSLTSILAETEPSWQEQQLNLSELDAMLHQGEQRVDTCKKVMAAGIERIHDCYENGTTASSLIRLQTRLTDLVICHCCNASLPADLLAHSAILAVGGYGRGELHPASDIDIAILIDRKLTDAHKEQIGLFIAELWDIGFAIGHSVRSLDESIKQARQDATVITNLMEARLLVGNKTQFQALMRAISVEHMWPPQAFFDAKMEEQSRRRDKYHNDAYRLEPNLKESNGGLRDIQTIFWVSQRVFGTREPQDLVVRGLLTPAELDTLVTGQDFLCRVRYLLHRLAGRAEDRLLFDHQRDIALAFGFIDNKRNEAIEKLMQVYYRKVTELQRLNEIILQGIGGIVSGVTAATKPIRLNERFQVRNGFLEVTNDKVFLDYPPALLEIFLYFSNTPEAVKFRANTVRLISSHLYLIDDQYRRDPVANQLFLDIFRNPNKLTRVIRMMARYGVMSAYLPAFADITGRMQFDLFHAYTVDEHTTRVIRNLRRFALEEFDDELPLCSQIMKNIEKPELLYLMGLFHDIAKGRGGDHSELGAVDAMKFCETHGLDKVDTGLVTWVVMNHLVMSMTAQRKDISDPEVIHQFASRVSSMKHLNYLYLMTVADIRGTNIELWNSFKDNLLSSLYDATARMLKRGLENPLDLREIVEHKKAGAIAYLNTTSPAQANQIWDRLDDKYFQFYNIEEIAIHCDAIAEHGSTESPLVLLFNNEQRGSTEVTIYLRESPNLFAVITNALMQLNLNILTATIDATKDGFALDSFYILEENGDAITELERADRITSQLENALANINHLPPVPVQRRSRSLQHFDRPPRIEFDNTVSRELTSVYINAIDYPGVLSLIARSFLKCAIHIHTAKIATMGEHIEDVFLITNAEGEKLSDAEQQMLRQDLLNSLPYNENPET